MRTLLLIVVALAVVGPAVVAYWLVPPEVLHAWPVLALTALPIAAGVLASLVFHGYRPLIEAPLPRSAADWLRSRIDISRNVGILVAAMERGSQRGSFYHPASRTIVLADDVHGEHTARAYATAAHELGHALFESDHPVLGRVLCGARQHAATCFSAGTGLLLGSTLVCAPGVRIAAFVLLGLAVVLAAAVVVEEAIATAIADRELSDARLAADQRAIARGHLRRALATYVSRLVAYAVPLVAAPWLLANVGDGLLIGAQPLVGSWGTVASVIAVTCLVASLGSMRRLVSRKSGLLGAAGILLSLFWAPLLAVLLCNRPNLPAWTVAFATVPAWSMLSVPALLVFHRLASFLGRDLEVMPLPFQDPRSLVIARVSVKTLARKEEPDGWFARLVSSAAVLWIVPLAVAWLAA